MRFTDDFEKREWLGREALKELKQLYPQYFKFDINFTTEKFAEYDAFYFVISDKQQIIKRVWLEIKIRDTTFEEYILETKKLKSLIKKRKDLYLEKEDVTFLYLNFCPTNTIIWNISNIDPDSSEKLMANKATSENRTDKVNKDVIMLKPEDGKQFNYVLNERLLMLKYDNFIVEKVKKEIKRRPGLEDILFGM